LYKSHVPLTTNCIFLRYF